MSLRRVVITGLGVVDPLGRSVLENFEKLLQKVSATREFDLPGFSHIPCKVASLVPDRDTLLNENHKYLNPSAEFAFKASRRALQDSGFISAEEPSILYGVQSSRFGVCFGAGFPYLEAISSSYSKVLEQSSYRKASPFFIPSTLLNMVAGELSIKYGLRGPNHCVSTACATGSHAIGDAFRMIRNGDCDAMLAGSSDHPVHPLILAGFARARSLASGFTSASEASRPFDKDRSGLVLGEGAGALVLESLDHALARSAPNIYAEILGYGMSGDAHDITAPSESGDGAMRAMRGALDDARGMVSADDINHVNAHATSTVLGDRAEAKAILSARLVNAKVTSLKGSLGHLMAAAGSVESAYLAVTCKRKQLPPTVNFHSPEGGFPDIDIVTETECVDRVIALKNSFGFGGTNASLIMMSYNR